MQLAERKKIKTVAKKNMSFGCAIVRLVPFSIPCHFDILIEFFHSKSRLFNDAAAEFVRD